MLFKEKLQTKFILGIFLMLTCVVLVALSTAGGSPHPKGSDMHKKHQSKLGYSLLCFCMALLAPLMISLFIAVSRFWTERFGYTGLDFTMDTYFVMGLVEIPFFIYHVETLGYTSF
jgi:drug/metabolite transporter (DMT)-like permease